MFKKAGFQVKRYPETYLIRRKRLITSNFIDLILDVGANIGQYGLEIRELGYNGEINSFEPLNEAFNKLKVNIRGDKKWKIFNYALGEQNGFDFINISKNSASSSIKSILPRHLNNAPESEIIGKESIEIKKLDSFFFDYYKDYKNVMLKIDTQGYEKSVLNGAEESLRMIRLIQIELSLVELYNDEVLFIDMLAYLKSKGFSLYSIEDGFYEKHTGQQLQVDVVLKNLAYGDI
jgi:FkbM family methyltransferase